MPRVFVSAALEKNLLPPQQLMQAAIVEALEAAGLDPQLVAVRGLPLDLAWNFAAAEDIIARCQGAVVLAFARHRFSTPEGPLKLPSEYNHYEGAIAISQRLPILIVAEKGIPDRGIAYRGGGKFIVSMPADATPDWLKSKSFKPYFDDWLKDVQSRRDVFLGYCSRAQATADAIIKYLQNVLKVSVMDWAIDFDPGPSILQRITEAAARCHCGIFLFTKDDAPPAAKAKLVKALPRDNVVFEAGYFMHAKGPNRVLIVLEEGAKMPADLGGNIYAALPNRKKIESIHEPLRKFCDAALDRG